MAFLHYCDSVCLLLLIQEPREAQSVSQQRHTADATLKECLDMLDVYIESPFIIALLYVWHSSCV